MTVIQLIFAIGGVVLLAILVAVLLNGRSKTPKKPTPAKGESSAVHPAVDEHGNPLPPEIPHITQADLQKLQEATQASYQRAVDDAAKSFHADLATTSQQLNKLIVNLTTDVVENELDDYRVGLANAREQALAALRKMESSVELKQKELTGDVESEMAKRRQFLMDRLDEKLGAAVAAYIVESLGMDADLGAQRSYLLANLERHKQELKEEIADGSSAK
jgi:vacuolar-type H+-ATPase subunit I/STV1